MALAEFPVNLPEARFALLDWLKVEEKLGWDAEMVNTFLDAGAKFAKGVLAPSNVKGDREGCRLEGATVKVPEAFHKVYDKFRQDEWFAATGPETWGGQAIPKTIFTMIEEFFTGANPAFSNYVGLTRAASNMLLAWGGDEQKKRYLPKLIKGQWQGTMCLTEPGAGSDVGASLAKATPRPDGSFLIQGTKSFITSGDHEMAENVVHAVLARVEGDPEGVKGLSLFLVPKFRVADDGALGERNDVVCVKVEEKMGIHGSATTTLQFGDNNACHGELVGGRGKGIVVMFHIMNEERLAVGIQGHSLGAAMALYAVDYAKDRVQGSDIGAGKSMTGHKVPIIEHPDVRRDLLTVRAYTDASRALMLRTALELDLLAGAENDDEKERREALIGFLTPICKAWGSAVGNRCCDIAMQVYGGYGYIAEYPAEQYLRDSRISAIYEGTNGIQAIDLLFRKVGGSQGRVLMQLGEELGAFVAANAAHPVLGKDVQALGAALEELTRVSQTVLMRMASGALRETALAASPYLMLCGNVLGGYFLLDQALICAARLPEDMPADAMDRRHRAAENRDLAFADLKVQTAKFYVHQILTQNRWLAAQCETEDASALAAAL